jgi:hypothetical protein
VFETLAVAIMAALVARRLQQRRVATSFAAGLLIASGTLVLVAAVGLLKFTDARIDSNAVVLAFLVLLGGVAIAVAGLGCLRTTRGPATVGPIDPRPFLFGTVGIGLSILSLFLGYDDYSTLWSELREWTSAEFAFEPFAAIAIMVAGIAFVSSRTRFASGLLLAVGVATALHFVGVLIAAWRAVGEVGGVQSAGVVGLLGGLLVAAAGAYALRPVAEPDRAAGAPA